MAKHGILCYSFLGLYLVQKLDDLGCFGFFFPSSAYPPYSPHMISYLLLLDVIPSTSPCIFPVHNWQEEKLPFVLISSSLLLVQLCTAAPVRAETAKSETPGSQNTLLCSVLLCCFCHEFFWVFCCFFYWWANTHNQTCLPMLVCMCLHLE